MAPMFPSDPIQDDDVHYILFKKKKNELFQIHRTTKQTPNLWTNFYSHCWKIKQVSENHLTINSNLRCPGSSLLTFRGSSLPRLIGREYKIFGSRDFKISAVELRTGTRKVKQILSLTQLLVARTSLVSPLTSSCLSGTWVVKLTTRLRLSVELMNRAYKEHIDNSSSSSNNNNNNNNNQSIKLDKVRYINSPDYSF